MKMSSGAQRQQVNGADRAHHRRPMRGAGAFVVAALALAATACSSGDAAEVPISGSTQSSAAVDPSAAAVGGAGDDCDTAPMDAAIDAYVDAGDVLADGPYGAASVDASSISLTDDEVEQLQGMGATAAIVMHFRGDNWSNAQVAALREQFETFGIEVVAQTDAEGNPSKQFSDIETALVADPDVMVSIPSLDPVALAPAYRQAVEQGVHLVFMENPAKDFEPGEDYVSVVATDNYGAGVISAHQMAKALCGSGSVGVIFHAAEAPTNKLRADGFIETIESDYPEIEILEDAGLPGPAWNTQANENVNSWLAQHPDLGGVWCWFDAPCEGAIDAARSNGRDDLAVTTIDLGNNVTTLMAQGEYVQGIAAAQPYRQGQVEATLAAYALLGKEAPPYVGVPVLPVATTSIGDAWQTVYEEDVPTDIANLLN